jgi:exodeoxyribonuclease-5
MMLPTPSDAQARAIAQIADWWQGRQPEFYLAGYAGTGKTTIAQLAVEAIEARARRALRVLYAAYTGKAADVLRRKTGQPATTLHRLLYRPVEEPETGKVRFVLNPDSPLADADLLVIDECSMATRRIADDVRSFGKRTLVLGDPGQLPPIDGASPFTDRTPDAFLHEIHRQAADSPILRLATMAREGRPIPFAAYGPGVRKIRRDRGALDAVRTPDAQVLCGIHRVRWKVTAFLRAQAGFDSLWPEPGEPLIGCRNEHDRGFWNGTLCRAEGLGAVGRGWREARIRTDAGDLHEMRIRVEPFLDLQAQAPIERSPDFQRRREHSLVDFAYVLSVHKAQGSQWQNVVVLDDSHAFRADAGRWLYTAITRAEQGLVIVSDHP